MKKLFATIAAAFSLGANAAPPSDQWTFGPFSMDAPNGYTYKEGRSPAVYTNSSGSVALISVHILDGNPRPEEMKLILENASKYARSTFESAAGKFGEVLQPYMEQKLPSGDTLASLPVVTQDSTGTGYLLQYAVISTKGHLAIITIEGLGAALESSAILIPTIRSARFRH